MSEKVKVLYFVDRMRHGGIQQLAVEIAKNIKDDIQIDFLVLNDGQTYPLEDTIKKLGCNLYKIDAWIYKPTDYINYYKRVNEFFQSHNEYKVIHINTSSKNYLILKLAKKYGIPVRIAHSHNIGFQSKNKIEILVGNLFKPLLKKYATHYFACSKLAGEWLFGKRETQKGNVKIINNAVDLQKFKFNEETRNRIRRELNIEDKLVIGHVGRFTNQKNHTFLIDIFYEIHKKNKNAVLMLIGKGETEDEIKRKVEALGLAENVLFMGFRDNINELMWAMDLFLFPSLYEGLGLVLIEAQATGLTCFTSKDVVPIEANISNAVHYISLNDNAETWAKEILSSKTTRNDNYDEIKKKGYDICDTGKGLEEFYINS